MSPTVAEMSVLRRQASLCPSGIAQKREFRGGAIHPNAADECETIRQEASPRRLLAADVYRATRQRPWRTPRRNQFVRCSTLGLFVRQERLGDRFDLRVKFSLPR